MLTSQFARRVSTDGTTGHGSTRSGAQGEGADNFVQVGGNRKIMLSVTILLRSVAERGECGLGAEKVKDESEATPESYP